MEQIDIEIEKGEYICNALRRRGYDSIPSNIILDKTLPGLGATQMEIDDNTRNSIIVEPNIPVIIGKTEKCPNSLAVWEKCTVIKVKQYLTDPQKKPKKLLTTPEGFDKIKKACKDLKIDIYKNFFFLFDECEKIVQDIDYRQSISNPINDFFEFEKKAFVTATYLPLKDPRFETEEFKLFKIKPLYEYKKDISLIITDDVDGHIKKKFEELNNSECICIFINSTSLIDKIVSTLKIDSESKVFCSKDSVKELKKKESKADIQENIQRPFKKYNFFTSRFFSAVDIEIDKKPDIIIITYAEKVKHTKIDPYTEAIQIYGRFRNTHYDKNELPFNSITHITDIATDNKKALTDDEVDLTLKEYKTTYDSLRKREEELYGVRRTAIQCNCSRVKYNDFIDENGELNYFSVDNLYNEERVKRHYESSEALINAYNSTNHFNSKLIKETNLIDNDFRLQLRKCKSSKDKRRSIITKLVYLHEIKMESYKIDEFKQDMKQEEINKDETGEWIIDVYSYFGEEYIRKNEYGCNQKMKNDLNRAKAKEKKSTPEVFQKVYNTFDIDTKIEKNEAKKRLEKIYEMFDIQKYDKAIQSDIEIYYNVKSYNNDKPATYKILNKKMEIG